MKTVNLTPFQIGVAADIMGMPDRGFPIKDLRLIDKAVKKLRSKIPPTPEMAQLPPPADGQKYTPEEEKHNQESQARYQDELSEREKTKVKVDLEDFEHTMVKMRLGSFKSFFPDEDRRARVLDLADEFGVE